MDLFSLHTSAEHQAEQNSANIDPGALAREMYSQEQRLEWKRTLNGDQKPHVLDTFTDQLNHNGGMEPAEPPLVQQYHKAEKMISDVIDHQARMRMQGIIDKMPEADRVEYEKEADKYEKDMKRHMETGTLLSPEPQPGETMKRYGEVVDQAMEPLMRNKVLLEQQLLNEMNKDDKFKDQYERWKNSRYTWL